MVADLIIPRVELGALSDALHWAPDGSIALNTAGQLTILKPKHTREEVKSASQLFDVQKFELEKLPSSQLYYAEMEDERTGTLFTSLDPTVTKLQWSPLFNNTSYLALITSHHDVLVLKDGELWKNLTTKKEIKSQAQFDSLKTHSMAWVEANDNLYFVQGLASGQIKFIEVEEIEEQEPIKVTDNAIVILKYLEGSLFAVSAVNEIFKIVGSEVEQLKGPDRFKIYDISIVNETALYYTTCGKVTKLEKGKKPLASSTGIMSYSQLFPAGSSNIVVVSQSQSMQFNSDLKQTTNDMVEPNIKKRVDKWNTRFNDFNTKRPSFKIFGADLNFSGNILALVYELDQNVKLKYQIASDSAIKVAFLPLKNNFENEGTTLSHFQEFKLTGHQREIEPEPTTPDYSVDLSTFFKEYIMHDSQITTWGHQNLITGDKDKLIKKKYATLLLKYIEQHKPSLTNNFDKAFVNNLNTVIGNKTQLQVPNLVVSGGTFTETFDFTKDQDPELLVSETETEWATCGLTFLPILTTQVKLDSATGKRFIDIEKDTWNEYGELTKTILGLCDISIYSGCRCVTK